MFFFSCKNEKEQEKDLSIQDVHSYAQPQEAVVKHLDLDIHVNFEEKIIEGWANLSISHRADAKHIILDTKHLAILKVEIADGEGKKTKANFTLGKEDAIMGTPLRIDILPSTQKVHIQYATSAEADALQWLMPEQTAGKQHPVLLTQSQAINARTWIPIQDGPGIRFTYSAKVSVPKELIALMSAENPMAKNEQGVYHFRMTQPIPAYLLALAVGDYQFSPISERVGVYAEPIMAEKCAKELAETEQMVVFAEAMYGKYAWERYDVIILPPSFPFGGMENPRLTFATPTIIVGDKSLVSLIAHELAHSWSGNLVTNATWNDFWLNEAFTVYVEMRIMEALKGRDYSEMLTTLSRQELDITLADLPAADQSLKLNLKGRNPDDGVTDIAYVKGYYFLRLLEETVGREKWDAFLKVYFAENAFKSMTTEGFLEKLKPLLSPKQAETVNIQEWVYGAGLPKNCPVAHSPNFEKVEAAQKAYLAGEKIATEKWNSHEWVHFLRKLPKELDAKKMAQLDKDFHFTESQNPEIQCTWYELALRYNYTVAYNAVDTFLNAVGRRKFLLPLYEEMMKTTDGAVRAKRIYAKARAGYHPISQQSVDDIVK